MLLAYGFRIFFLGAALAALGLMPAWLAALSGWSVVHGPADPVSWHAHEMLFGFIGAVFAGFFLTAVPSWTSRPRLHGLPLAGLALLWFAGRLLMLVGGGLPWGCVAAVDVLFLPVLAGLIAVPIIGTRSRRNYAFPLLFLLLAMANLCMHLAWAGVLPGSGPRARLFALHAILLVLVIFGGRVTPLFTRGALGQAVGVRPRTFVDSLALALTTLLLAVSAVPVGAAVHGVVALAAAVANGARMWGWATRKTLREPLLWVLHAGYAWIPVALVLETASAWWPAVVPRSAAVHAIAVGVVGTYVLAMISRVALGHTGRPLKLHPLMAPAYIAIILAGLVRVLGALLGGEAGLPMLHISGTLWVIAFAAYVFVYTPILLRPRADGRPG